MKVFAAILLLATLAQSRPRHILVPYDDEIEEPQVLIFDWYYAQFYIQLVFKAPLCITFTISDQNHYLNREQ